MTDKYEKICEMLWEELLKNKDKFDFKEININKPSPIYQIKTGKDILKELIDKVQNQLDYEMSEFQITWAVMKMYWEVDIEEYKKNKK